MCITSVDNQYDGIRYGSLTTKVVVGQSRAPIRVHKQQRIRLQQEKKTTNINKAGKRNPL